jgi:hypothetical protein
MTPRYVTLLLFVTVALAGPQKQANDGSAEWATMSESEANALWEKEIEQHNEALKRLPQFSEDRLGEMLSVLREVKYPISLEKLSLKLGGPNALVWLSDHTKLQDACIKQTSTFIVAHTLAEDGRYVLIVDFEDAPLSKEPTMVGRARLCYQSPFGWTFAAESLDDRLRAGSGKQSTN